MLLRRLSMVFTCVLTIVLQSEILLGTSICSHLGELPVLEVSGSTPGPESERPNSDLAPKGFAVEGMRYSEEIVYSFHLPTQTTTMNFMFSKGLMKVLSNQDSVDNQQITLGVIQVLKKGLSGVSEPELSPIKIKPFSSTLALTDIGPISGDYIVLKVIVNKGKRKKFYFVYGFSLPKTIQEIKSDGSPEQVDIEVAGSKAEYSTQVFKFYLISDDPKSLRATLIRLYRIKQAVISKGG